MFTCRSFVAMEGTLGLRMQVLCSFLVSLAITECSSAITEIRLVDGPSPNEGRVEVYIPARGWGTACSTGWDIFDSVVVCRQLGFPGANSFAFNGSTFGPGTGPILIKNAACNGSESSLDKCPFDEDVSGCSHARDAAVICHKPGYLGCFGDSTLRVFSDGFFEHDAMTIDLCIDYCRIHGHEYAGLEYASECYCGSNGTNVAMYGEFHDSECQYQCLGNLQERCGGVNRIAVFGANDGFCEDPGVPSNGLRHGGWFRYGVTMTFLCASGYELIGNQTIQCLSSDGHQSVDWTGDTPLCVEPTEQPTTSDQLTLQRTETTGSIMPTYLYSDGTAAGDVATSEASILGLISSSTTTITEIITEKTSSNTSVVEFPNEMTDDTDTISNLPSTDNTLGIVAKTSWDTTYSSTVWTSVSTLPGNLTGTGTAGQRYWPPMAIGLLIGGIFLSLLLIAILVCLIVLRPRAKAKRHHPSSVYLRDARQGEDGTPIVPDIVVGRSDYRYHVRKAGKANDHNAVYDNRAYLVDDHVPTADYDTHPGVVDDSKPNEISSGSGSSRKALFGDGARKLNQIYVPSTPGGSHYNRGTDRTEKDNSAAQLVI